MLQRKSSLAVWVLVLALILVTAVAGMANAAELQGLAKITVDNSNFVWGDPIKGKINWIINAGGKDFSVTKSFSIAFPYKELENKLAAAGLLNKGGGNTTTNTNTDPGSVSLTADEKQMLDLVNKERTSRGLAALKANLTLTQVARAHSQDMINRSYFSHTNPDGKSSFDRMKAAGVTYQTAGENLAGAPNAQTAHTNLMNSSGHRANILKPNFTEVGIGIIDGGRYGKMFTQNFIGK